MIGSLVVLSAASVSLLPGCSSTYPNRTPTGEPFPTVSGRSLEDEPVDLPAAWTGSPTVVLVGYKQKTQFDIDRWVMGLLQSGADARIVELPTMPGLVPSAISGWIDDGMRSGIPREDWSAVVTLYGSSAKPVAKWTGTENGRLARVIVLDGDGRVIWFDDAGYSAKKALAVAELVESESE